MDPIETLPPELAALGGAAFSAVVLYVIVRPIVSECFAALKQTQELLEGRIAEGLHAMSNQVNELAKAIRELIGLLHGQRRHSGDSS